MKFKGFIPCLICAMVAAPLMGQKIHPKSRLDAMTAANIASSLANVEADKQFQSEPFSNDKCDAVFGRGRWHWTCIAAFGKSDLEASVSFDKDGSNPKVEVKQIVLFMDFRDPL